MKKVIYKKKQGGFIHIKKTTSNYFVIISDYLGKVVYKITLNALHLHKSVLTKTGERLLFTKVLKVFLSYNVKYVFIKLEGLDEEDIITVLKHINYKLSKKKVKILGLFFKDRLPHNGCRKKKKKLS